MINLTCSKHPRSVDHRFHCSVFWMSFYSKSHGPTVFRCFSYPACRDPLSVPARTALLPGKWASRVMWAHASSVSNLSNFSRGIVTKSSQSSYMQHRWSLKDTVVCMFKMFTDGVHHLEEVSQSSLSLSDLAIVCQDAPSRTERNAVDTAFHS